MTEEAAAWISAAGAAIGAAWLYVTKRRKQDDPMSIVQQRVSELERRANDTDRRFEEVFHLLHDVDENLARCRTDVQVSLARLDERRHKQGE